MILFLIVELITCEKDGAVIIEGNYSSDYSVVAPNGSTVIHLEMDQRIRAVFEKSSEVFFLRVMFFEEDDFNNWIGQRKNDSAWHDCSQNYPGQVDSWDVALYQDDAVKRWMWSQKGDYVMVVQNCEAKISGTWILKMNFYDKSDDIFILQIMTPIFMGLCLGGCVCWIFLIVKRKVRLLPPTAILSVPVFFSVLYLSFYEGQLYSRGKPLALRIFACIFQTFMEGLLLCVLFFLGSGWRITTRQPPGWCFVLTSVGCLTICGSAVAQEKLGFATFWEYSLLYGTMGFFGLLTIVISGWNWWECRKTILAHLVAIGKQGINPFTTPIARKLSLILTFESVAASALIWRMAVCLTVLWSGWLGLLLRVLFVVGITLWLVYLLRPLPVECDWFLNKDLEEVGQPQRVRSSVREFTNWLAAIEIDPESRMSKWEEGVKLPPEPLVLGGPRRYVQRRGDGTQLQTKYMESMEEPLQSKNQQLNF
jgi:hypothetical protein